MPGGFLHNIDMAEQSLWLQNGDGEIVDTNPSHYITTFGILVNKLLPSSSYGRIKIAYFNLKFY